MTKQLPLDFRLQNHTRLQDYVGQAAQRLTALRGTVVVEGAGGSGKSHLLQGLCHEQQGALYLSSLKELAPTILSGLEGSPLVCLDDVDDVLGCNEWQEALFELFNACRDKNTSLVMSLTGSVGNITTPLRDLHSRLHAAYRVSTDQLSDDQKLSVIKIKASRRGFRMSDDVCRFILARAKRDMHHLARLVEQLDKETLRRQKKVTIPLVKDALDL